LNDIRNRADRDRIVGDQVSAVKWSLWEIGAASGKEKEQQSKQQRVTEWLVVGHAFLRKGLWIVDYV
jgi:hypothetical protein